MDCTVRMTESAFMTVLKNNINNYSDVFGTAISTNSSTATAIVCSYRFRTVEHIGHFLGVAQNINLNMWTALLNPTVVQGKLFSIASSSLVLKPDTLEQFTFIEILYGRRRVLFAQHIVHCYIAKPSQLKPNSPDLNFVH